MRGKNDKFTGIVFGVVPEFHGKGIDYYMIVQGAEVMKYQTNYKHLELQWQGDFNPKILNISKNKEENNQGCNDINCVPTK